MKTWRRLMKALNNWIDAVDRGDWNIGVAEDGYEHYG